MRWLKANPDYLERASQRAEPFLYLIVDEAERRGLPLELALLPVVESGYQPLARSPDHAKGLWQFMPRTGKAFGLRRSWWYDGRSDVHASTYAAFDYLTALAAQFDGDWELALAAYNAGPGSIRRAIRRNEKKGLATDFWSLDLARETEQYVPRLLAISRVVRAPSQYGVSLAPVPNQPQLARVKLPGQIDVAIAAKLCGIDQNRLKDLNPGLRRATSDPDGPHHLLVPVTHVDGFREKLAAADPKKLVTRHRYLIRQGDTLGSIAVRHGTSVRQLQRLNHMRNTHLRAGRFLFIPGGTEETVKVAKAKKAGPPSRYKNALLHVVLPGDTLWDIARVHRTSHRKLAALNNLAVNETLRPGQTLMIRTLTGKDAQNSFSYRVRKGDSLYLIARRFNVSLKDLRRWNPLPGRYLQPGQKLTLHPKKSAI